MKRRNLIIGGVTVSVWSKPVIESVIIPAHAQTSPPVRKCQKIINELRTLEERLITKLEELEICEEQVVLSKNTTIDPCLEIKTEIEKIEIEIDEKVEELRICKGEPEKQQEDS